MFISDQIKPLERGRKKKKQGTGYYKKKTVIGKRIGAECRLPGSLVFLN